MRLTRQKLVYFKRGFDLIINLIFIIILLFIVFGLYTTLFLLLRKIPNLNNYMGNLISAGVTLFLAVVSYATKIKKYIKKTINKVKQKLYILLSARYSAVFSKLIENYNINKLSGTTEQANVINFAINKLKNNRQNILLISSVAGKGKSTTLMLLLDIIAHDVESYNLFTELHHHIIYFDSVTDFDLITACLSHPEKQTDKIIIIDNIQKYTLNTLNEVIRKINNLIAFAKEDEKKVLFALLYQKTAYNEISYRQISKTYFVNNKIIDVFTLKEIPYLVKKKNRNKNDFLKNINKLQDPLLKHHLKNILYNCKNISFIDYVDQLLFSQEKLIYSHNEKMKIYVLASIVFVCNYYGYVTNDTLIMLWKKTYRSMFQLKLIIFYYISNKILSPFHFIPKAYIFNEQLANEYKKILINNNYFSEVYFSIAKFMFTFTQNFYGIKWLYLISCSPDFCKSYSQENRIRLFEETLNAYNLHYILEILENEISIIPEKKDIFRQELGIIYIQNGEWKKAKEILYPYIHEHNINKDIWQIQLKIIEAEHGCEDQDNLEMLKCMKEECTDSVIHFQIDYWREHIFMEHGKFSLKTWEKLLKELCESEKLLSLRKDEHFFSRVVSDYERTYFLIGKINYAKYKSILNLYSFQNDEKTNSLEKILSRAYYIQYDILYQLGIWGYIEYKNITPEIIKNPSIIEFTNTIEELIRQAASIYDTCIDKYQSAGKKKYRTLQVRRAELTLCIDSDQYINVLNKYNEFESYAKENNIVVFEGYCNTQKGKAFTLYAISEFRNGKIDNYEMLLNRAISYLRKAKKLYAKFGNVYGEMRATLLIILIVMIQKRGTISKKKYKSKFEHNLSELITRYNIDIYYKREYNIVRYLQNNILKIDLPTNIIRFYPIILQ